MYNQIYPANYLQVEESEYRRLVVSFASHLERKQKLQMEVEGKSKEPKPNREYFEKNIKEFQKSIDLKTEESQSEAVSEERQKMEKRSLDKDIEEQADE